MPQVSHLTLVLGAIAVYFMWMDVALYINLQQVPPGNQWSKAKSGNNNNVSTTGTVTFTDYETFSPFHPLSIKLLFQVKRDTGFSKSRNCLWPPK